MTTKELHSEFNSLQQAIEKNDYLISLILKLSGKQEVIEALQVEMYDIGGDVNHKAVPIRNKLDGIVSELRAESPKKIFIQIESLFDAFSLSNYSKMKSSAVDPFAGLMASFQAFGSAYEHFIQVQERGALAKLLSVAQKTSSAIDSAVEFLDAILASIGVEEESVDSGQIQIFLPSQSNFNQFIEKAEAVEKIYEELCMLFKVSIAQEPLRIIKVESGSQWMWLAGNKKILEFAQSLILKSAGFIYRNYTKEGKLSAVSGQAEIIKDGLRLSDEFKKRNLPTNGMEENLSKASVALSKNLAKLLEGEEQIEIDGETVPLTPSSQQNLIGNKKIRLIEDINPNDGIET